ncbi:hypothetical protein [Synechococcus sp. MIT S9504]|uniref:hypothetical protein n=1 Tax=Synechococcus sp. MIT S9504 TaxID=1801628 RepID=UPI0018D378E0|nr:hypothetical protein [Synechococcus sp. MIT S9504]
MRTQRGSGALFGNVSDRLVSLGSAPEEVDDIDVPWKQQTLSMGGGEIGWRLSVRPSSLVMINAANEHHIPIQAASESLTPWFGSPPLIPFRRQTPPESTLYRASHESLPPADSRSLRLS